MGRRANIAGSVVEDQVLEVDQFPVDPQRGAGVGELGAFEEARADRRTRDALVETGERDAGVESRSYQGTHADFREIVSH
ncbi:hypothetical protein GA0061101_1094 [Rhizobium lusitanum]|uniref:Uncharacterized protein n=1 Tax=Rhizobium lusitanum TaxID=293958 RepID=A0A1C3W820_9HYPH|nr:hypothetical protein GA0061101_1094 [Rhizobium lusitanum]